MTDSRQRLAAARRIVVKIGSALLTNDGQGLDHDAIATWADQIARLVKGGLGVALVSSGSIGEGMVRLGWAERPQAIEAVPAPLKIPAGSYGTSNR